jgi:hypothetical protein
MRKFRSLNDRGFCLGRQELEIIENFFHLLREYLSTHAWGFTEGDSQLTRHRRNASCYLCAASNRRGEEIGSDTKIDSGTSRCRSLVYVVEAEGGRRNIYRLVPEELLNLELSARHIKSFSYCSVYDIPPT